MNLFSDCKLYVLESVNIIRKYVQLLDLPISLLSASYWYLITYDQKNNIKVSVQLTYIISSKTLIFIIVANIKELPLQKAMAAHESQYVWFRKLYMIFSRYTFINTLQEVCALDLELDLQFDDE